MKIDNITSAQNPKIKELLALQEKSKERKKKGLFVVEGRRELLHCIEAGYEPFTLFLCPEIISSDDRREIEQAIMDGNRTTGQRMPAVIQIPQHLYDKVAYRGGTEGVIAEMYCKDMGLETLTLKENPLVVVLEAVEKPGNLGAVLRSANAAGADAVIVCDPLTDMYNPNLIRSSIGAIFTVPVATASTEECINWLKDKGIKIYTAQLQDSEWYYDTDMKGGSAIVMGTEATGLTDTWRMAADAHIKIPMLGHLDSLNVSVSAAILLYEAVRQRNSR
ncbi:MAG: RNA methyltransferase [Bacteroidales bacterium]|nr:RNA methyltransferase [Bacteroidales bacterium]